MSALKRERTALVTGASSGIGYAVSKAFCERGINVIGTSRSLERLQVLEADVNTLPEGCGAILPLEADVRRADDMARVVHAGLDRFGSLDIIVANAGLGHRGSVVDATWHDVQTLLETNIHGVLHTIRAGVPAMQGGGHIIVISSVVYNTMAPYAAYYAASKAFVSSLSRSLRLELADSNIVVTDMLVGRVETAFSDNRLGKAGRAGSFPPAMPVDRVARAVVRAVSHNRRTVTLRWIDRLIVTANVIVPGIIGRRALKQYR